MLKPGGRTAFLTIAVAPGLSKSTHRRAVRLGPRAVAATRPIPVLMEAAGYRDIDIEDVTDDFLQTARAWGTEAVRYDRELRQQLGDDEVERRAADRRGMIQAVEESLLQRLLVSASAPNRGTSRAEQH